MKGDNRAPFEKANAVRGQEALRNLNRMQLREAGVEKAHIRVANAAILLDVAVPKEDPDVGTTTSVFALHRNQSEQLGSQAQTLLSVHLATAKLQRDEDPEKYDPQMVAPMVWLHHLAVGKEENRLKYAERVLTRIIENELFFRKLVECGGVETMVGVICSETAQSRVRATAGACLRWLASDLEAADTMVDAGVFAPCVHLMQTGVDDERAVAVTLLQALAEHTKYHPTFLRQGVVAGLRMLLENDYSSASCAAVLTTLKLLAGSGNRYETLNTELTSNVTLGNVRRVLVRGSAIATAAAAGFMAALARVVSNRMAVVDADTVEPLAALLSRASVKGQCSAAHALGELAGTGSLKRYICDCAGKPLVAVLTDSSMSAKLASAEALLAMVECADNHASLVRWQLLPALFREVCGPMMTGEEDVEELRTRALRLLGPLVTHPDCLASLRVNTVVKRLFEIVAAADSPPQRVAGAMVLRNLASVDGGRDLVLNDPSGTLVAAIVRAMARAECESSVYAVGMVRNMAASEIMKPGLVENDAIPELISTLRVATRDLSARINAAAALTNLAANNRLLKVKITNHGCFRCCLSLIHRTDTPLELVVACCDCLTTLALHERVEEAAAELETVRYLIKRLRADTDTKVREALLRCMRNLSVHPLNRKQIIEFRGMSVLTSILTADRGVQPHLIPLATLCLRNVSADKDCIGLLMHNLGLFNELMIQMRSLDDLLVHDCVILLQHFAVHSVANTERLRRHKGMLPKMIALLSCADEQARVAAATVIGKMVERDEVMQLASIKGGVLPEVMRLIQSKSESIGCNAAGILWKLAESKETHREILMSGGRSNLEYLLTYGREGARRNALGALRALGFSETILGEPLDRKALHIK